MKIKRDIENFRNITVIFLIISIVSNTIYYMNSKGIYIKSLLEIKVINAIVGIGLLFVLYKQIPNIRELRKSPYIKKVTNEMYLMNLINFIIVGYLFFSIIEVRKIEMISSAFVIEIGYIVWYVLTIYKKILRKSDVQLKWKKAWILHDYSEEDSNVFWRMKIWWGEHEKVSFKERIKRYKKIGFIIYILICSFIFYDPIFVIIVMVVTEGLLGHPLLYLIDLILGLFISTKGICTDVIKREFTNKRDLGGGEGIAVSLENKQNYYYTIYVTYFKKKRELKFHTKECGYIEEGKEYVVVHGVLSKRVIRIKGVEVEFLNQC